MPGLRGVCILVALCFFAPASVARADSEAFDPEHVRALAVAVGDAADEGYRLSRNQGDGTASRLAVKLRRLRTQTRILRADLAKGRSPRELERTVRTIQMLARDLEEEASEDFASTRFEQTSLRLRERVGALAASLSEPSHEPRLIALDSDGRSNE